MKIHKKDKNLLVQIILLLVTGLVLGFLIITQSKYFTSYVSSVGRDSSENIFRKIQILKISNDELEEEVLSLEEQFEDLSNQSLALESIENEIEKNKSIAGEVNISGPGIEIEFDIPISALWFIDLTNELFASGAEAISINNIRLTDSTIGFDTLPNGQIMINNVILSQPYTFSAIGDKDTLKQTLESPLGILDRMEASIENFDYTIKEKDLIEMKKV